MKNRSGSSDKLTMLALLWALGLVGALMLPLHLIPEGHSSSICGPWGCGPTTASLATWHCFWIVLLVFPTSLICSYVPRNPLRWLGGALVVLGLLSFVTIGWWEKTHWLQAMPESYEIYLQQRIFHVIALCGVPMENTLPKELILPVIPRLPISQIFLMGLGTFTFGIFFKKQSQPVVDTESYSTIIEQPDVVETDSNSQSETNQFASQT